MNQSDSFKKSICGDPQCPGSSCLGCNAFRDSEKIHASILCPLKAPSCFAAKLCGMCQAIKNSLDKMRESSVGGGKARDLDSRQKFSSNRLNDPVICELCKDYCGANLNCEWCSDFNMTIARGGGDGGSACEAHSTQRPQQTSKLVARGGSGGGRAEDDHSIRPPLPAPIVKFNQCFFHHTYGYPNKWTYREQHETACFNAEGTFKDEPYSDMIFLYNGKEYLGPLLKIVLRDACIKFLQNNPPK